MCTRDEGGREEMGGYGSGEEERREPVKEGSKVVRDGKGGRCMVELEAIAGGVDCFADRRERRGFANPEDGEVE